MIARDTMAFFGALFAVSNALGYLVYAMLTWARP
jgi:hypothetical protein